MIRGLRPALLALEDGRLFHGRSFGAPIPGSGVGGEVVFNTGMSGYQEILTDPSYAGQVVVMTCPLIGNYGITAEDFESRQTFAIGLIVKEPSPKASNWRHTQTLGDFLVAHNRVGFCDLDTRALVRHLRRQGSLRGVVAHADNDTEVALAIARAKALPAMAGRDLASEVTQSKPYQFSESTLGTDPASNPASNPNSRHVVAYDFGIKRNILRMLVQLGARVTVVPATTSAQDVLARRPDGVVLGNGPGDPEPVAYAVDSVRSLIGRVPIFGICLGHQILGLAAGGRTYKLKFGHHGNNHPVQDLTTGKVEITSHNHGFAIDPDSLPDTDVQLTHINLNDQTVEGICLRNAPAFSVQYHPEGAPGPHDAGHLFERFVELMGAWKNGCHSGKE